MRKFANQVIEGAMKENKEENAAIRDADLLSTGSTLLNLALSGRARGGYPKGKYILVVGDSAAGKTVFAMTMFAEAAKNSAFKDYRLIYDNVEDGMLFNVDKLFGETAADRIEPPAIDEDGEPSYSTTIEEFYYHVHDAAEGEKPFIYVLDSMDGVTSEAEDKKFKQDKKAYRKGKDAGGSYGDGKAKKNSSGLRQIVRSLRASGSILIIIAQTRDVLNAGPFTDPKTRSGGRAMRFYATCEFWLSKIGAFKKKIRGKARPFGDRILIKVKKNRLTGNLPIVKTAIYPSYGVDDAGSCVDFLLEEKWWKKRSGKIAAGPFGLTTKGRVIKEACGGKMKELRKEVTACWRAIEAESSLGREPRYS